MAAENRVWRLRKRPTGEIADDDLSFGARADPEPGPGELLVKLDYLSLDPTNRVWMSDVPQYMPPGGDRRAHARRDLRLGRHVEPPRLRGRRRGERPWHMGRLPDRRPWAGQRHGADRPGRRCADAFGLFAVIGPTAYFGLLDHGEPKPGETLVVSRRRRRRRLGRRADRQDQGLPRRRHRRQRREVPLDPRGARLRRGDQLQDRGCRRLRFEPPAPTASTSTSTTSAAPILEACLDQMNLFGRIPMCGQISHLQPHRGRWRTAQLRHDPHAAPAGARLHRARPPGPLPRGHRRAPGMDEPRVGSHSEVEVHDGLENAVKVVRRLYTGDHLGKLLIRA